MRWVIGLSCQAALILVLDGAASANLINLEPSHRPSSPHLPNLPKGSWLESGERETTSLTQTGYGPLVRSAHFAKQRGYLHFELYNVRHNIPTGYAIVEAEVRFSRGLYDSPDEFETLGIFDVRTPPHVLVQTGVVDPSIYEDLGTGELYGSMDVTAANTSPFAVKLNSAGVAAINRSLDGSFSLGLSLLTLRPNPMSTEMLFKGQFATSPMLHMRMARVPESGVATMVVAIVAATKVVRLKRRRQ
jgi:hypothetical protein